MRVLFREGWGPEERVEGGKNFAYTIVSLEPKWYRLKKFEQ